MKRKSRKSSMVLVIIFSMILVIAVAICYTNGLSENKLEDRARGRLHINESWECSKSYYNNLASLLFYDVKKDKAIYTIYKNEIGVLNGVFLLEVESNQFRENGVFGISYGNQGMIIISQNKEEIAHIVTEKDTIDIDDKRPFTIVLPPEAGTISLYDQDGNEVVLDNVELR